MGEICSISSGAAGNRVLCSTLQPCGFRYENISPEKSGLCGSAWERLVLEEKSTNTKENLKFSDALTGCSQKNTGILSNNFHVYRAVKIAEKAGYEHPYGIAAPSDPIMQVHYVVREAAALIKAKIYGNI